MILNQATASLRRIPFELFDAGGVPITGSIFATPPATGEVQISKAGGAYADVAGSVTQIGAGSYYYEATTGEVDTLGLLILKVIKSGAQTYKYSDEVISEPATGSLTAADVFAFAHQSGRTFLGLCKRLDQLLTGKHTGMLGTLWKLFDVDGTTELVRAVQDPVVGTRDAATIVGGD